MRKNPLYKKCYAFSITVIDVYRQLQKEHKEFHLAGQLLKSGTSIGANVSEANGGISTADFSAKISIAYKESLETKYWISLLGDTGYIGKKQALQLYEDADELCRILFSILKTTRIKHS